MEPTEQAIDQTLRITLTGVEYALRLSGSGAKNLAAALWSVATSKQKTKGKARLESLLKSNKELKVFNISERELSTFAKEAKRYGVLYAIIKGVGINPDALVDIMVKAEDAAKINRIVEKLKYGRFDATEVVVEAERDIANSYKSEFEIDPTQKDAGQLLDELLGDKTTPEGAPLPNPTIARSVSPFPSERTSETDGHQETTTAETVAAGSDNHKVKSTNSRTSKGFADNRERSSVKAQIEQKRASRADNPSQVTSPNRQPHQQSTQPTKGNMPKSVPAKGR